ncbi:hypothetical protein EZV73_20495 [Acidaminobacter sp. JC074]|uniref:hypothetical protein n=1 Tax=Acidaminobacter sp. JC074 TaxID=2530199 RepID=UPI001F0DA91F|nr:hypothetical protein [Acidaminobacter sp. JC074]MCH4889971.1 hypothetical protein [Acidaminobacter sp. JC074]
MRIINHETTINFRRLDTNQGTFTKVSKSYSGSAINRDQFQMSALGRRMSKLMNAAKAVGPEKVKSRLDHVNEEMSSLNLDEINVDKMSREELEAKLTEVQEVILELRPDAEINLTDFEGKTDEELKASLNGVVDRVDTAKEELSTIKLIVTKLYDRNENVESSDIEENIVINEEDLFDEVIASLEEDGSEEALELSKAIAAYLEA